MTQLTTFDFSPSPIVPQSPSDHRRTLQAIDMHGIHSFSDTHLRIRIAALKLRPLVRFPCNTQLPLSAKAISYTSLLSLQGVFFIGYKIHTEDGSINDPVRDASNTLDVLAAFFKCADELAETDALPDQEVIYCHTY